MKVNNKTVQYFVGLAVSLAAVTSGVIQTWTTAVIPKFHDNQTEFQISDSEISWIVAAASPGWMTGSLTCRFLSDKFGRRATLLASALPIAIGTIAMICTSNVWVLCFTKYVWDIGTGMICTVSTIYLAEIADKDIRGTLSVQFRFMFNFGMFLTLVIGPFVSFSTLNYMILALPVLYFITCSLVPESPYFYLKEGKVDEARNALIGLRGDQDEKLLEDELSTMRSDVKKDMRRSGSAKEFFIGKRYRRALLIGAGLKIGQMATGTIAIQHYLGRIIQDSQYSINLATVFIVFGALRFLVGVMSSMIADKIGRRPLLIYSYLGTGLSLTLVTIYFFCQEVLLIDQDQLSSCAVVVFIGIVLSNIISNLGYNSIIYAIHGEIFPLNVKSVAVTFLNIFGGLLSFTVNKTYQPLKDAAGLFGVFCVFTLVSFAGVLFSYFLIPETKGKSLGEIQVLMQGIYYDIDVVPSLPAVDIDDSIRTELKPMIEKKE